MKRRSLILMGIILFTAGQTTQSVAQAKETSKAGARSIASYSDSEIVRNEIEKKLVSSGFDVSKLTFKNTAPTKPMAHDPISCVFGNRDYWYAYGVDGGCGINAGNGYGETAAGFEINKKIKCTLKVDMTKCTITGQLEIDGRNACNTNNPIDVSAMTAMSNARGAKGNAVKSDLPIIPGNVCLAPNQLEAIRKQWTSLSFGSNTRVLNVMVGGYPGINCMGGWGVTVQFGHCLNTPVPVSAPMD